MKSRPPPQVLLFKSSVFDAEQVTFPLSTKAKHVSAEQNSLHLNGVRLQEKRQKYKSAEHVDFGFFMKRWE
jgi:hypothetical protein